MSSFSDLGLATPLLRALEAQNHVTPTPIQTAAIPSVRDGRDLLGVAQTGTGKTGAFALPMLHRLMEANRRPPRKGCRALILSPTRELASQIQQSFRDYGRHLPLTSTVVFGGVPIGRQIRALANGVDVLVATPGRLLDLIGENALRLDLVEIFVLDEADQMLDMGFIQPIRRIVARLPNERQNLFFSATMPDAIGELAGQLLRDPVKVAVTPVATTAERVDQRVWMVSGPGKRSALAEALSDETLERALVFARTKHGADKIVRQLVEDGIDAEAIHGNKSQGQRERALGAFRTGRIKVLVATDIAARGIDVAGVTHVVNHDMPNVPESYVHRIGRTARAGAEGIAISLVAPDERGMLREIQKLIRMEIPSEDRGGASLPTPPASQEAHRRQGRNARGGGQPPQRSGRGGEARGDGRGGKPQQRPARGGGFGGGQRRAAAR